MCPIQAESSLVAALSRMHLARRISPRRAIYSGGARFQFTCMRGVGRMTSYIYRIIIKGHLDGEWSDWFEGLTVTLMDTGETILTGPIVDQTALHGVLIKIRDLGLPLLALTSLPPERGDATTPFRHSEEERGDG